MIVHRAILCTLVMPPSTYGLTRDYGDVLLLDLKQPPDKWGVCELAKFGHEMKHILGAQHEYFIGLK